MLATYGDNFQMVFLRVLHIHKTLTLKIISTPTSGLFPIGASMGSFKALQMLQMLSGMELIKAMLTHFYGGAGSLLWFAIQEELLLGSPWRPLPVMHLAEQRCNKWLKTGQRGETALPGRYKQVYWICVFEACIVFANWLVWCQSGEWGKELVIFRHFHFWRGKFPPGVLWQEAMISPYLIRSTKSSENVLKVMLTPRLYAGYSNCNLI